MECLISILFGYFLGSIPFGLVLAYLSGYGDIRKQGSGNIGTTNVLRVTKRKDLTLLTLILDAGKAGFAALLATWLFGWITCRFGRCNRTQLPNLVEFQRWQRRCVNFGYDVGNLSKRWFGCLLNMGFYGICF